MIEQNRQRMAPLSKSITSSNFILISTWTPAVSSDESWHTEIVGIKEK